MESRDIYDLEHELRERDERLRERAAESVAKAQLVLQSEIPGEDAPRDELVRLSDSIGLEDMTHSMDEHDTAGPREYERINFERILDPEIDGRSGTVSGRTSTSYPSQPREQRRSSARRVESQGQAAVEESRHALEVEDMPEATVRLLRAKLKASESLVKELEGTAADRDKQLTEALKELKAARGQRDGMEKQIKSGEAQAKRLQARAERAEEEAAILRAEVQRLQSRLTEVDKEAKAVLKDNSSRDVRLNRALEEVDRLKQLLAENKQASKGKEVSSAEHSRVMAELKKLERQKQELLSAFKKQARLIDVLKRQKIHMEAARMLAFSEEEFMRALELGSKR